MFMQHPVTVDQQQPSLPTFTDDPKGNILAGQQAAVFSDQPWQLRIVCF